MKNNIASIIWTGRGIGPSIVFCEGHLTISDGEETTPVVNLVVDAYQRLEVHMAHDRALLVAAARMIFKDLLNHTHETVALLTIEESLT